MRFSLLISVFFILNAHAATKVDFPWGGSFYINSSEWRVERLTLKNQKFLMLFHKGPQELQGQVLNGPISDQGACEKKSSKKFISCLKETFSKSETSYQIVAQRMVSPKAYQHYYFTFTVPKNKSKELKPIIDKFNASLGLQK